MKTVLFARLSLAVAGVVGLSSFSANAAIYDWNVTAGSNWSNPGGGGTGWTPLPPGSYPKAPGETARIRNTFPVNWTNVADVVAVDVADINGADMVFRDDNPPANNKITFQVNQNAAFNQIDWFNDNGGSGRSDISIAAGKTLSVNKVNMTGRFVDRWFGANITTSVLKWTPDGSGVAEHDYFVQNGSDSTGGMTWDFTNVTTMKWVRNGGSSFEARDADWKVGNASVDQTWTMTGGLLELRQRLVGQSFNFYKTGNNNIDMGKRTGGNPSDGVQLSRGFDVGGDEVGDRKMFTDTAGAGVGGTVRIADYLFKEDRRDSAQNYFMFDRIGANLTVTDGGSFRMRGNNGATTFNEANVAWLVAGRNLTVEGTAGNIDIDKTGVTGTGRMGINYSGATLTAGGSLFLRGADTFLNDNGVASTISVAGSVQVQSRNPTGFGTLAGLQFGATASVDDFKTAATTLTMNGGGAKSLDWDTGNAGSGNTFALGDFTQANFTIDTLNITGNTSVTYAARNLYLDGDTTGGLNIDLGSVLNFTGGHIYILDPNNSEYARLQTYPFGRILGAQVLRIEGVGELITVPEPTGLALMSLFVVSPLLRRRRRV